MYVFRFELNPPRIVAAVVAGVATVPLLFVCGLAAADGWRATPLRLVLAGGVRMLLFAALSTLVLAFFEQNIAGAALWTNGSLYQPGATGLALVARWLVVPLILGCAGLTTAACRAVCWISIG